MFDKIAAWFKHSETLVWARLQVLFGLVLGTILVLDPYLVSSILPENWAPYWLLFSGILTELARRYRAKNLE